MKTRNVIFSPTDAAHYAVQTNVTELYAEISLHRMKGFVPSDARLSLAHRDYIKRKPDVTMYFPNIHSIDTMILSLMNLKRDLIQKKNLGMTVEDVLGNMSPEQIYRALKRIPGVRMQRMNPSQMRKILSKDKDNKRLQHLIQILHENLGSITNLLAQNKEKEASKEEKAEPANN